MSRWEPGMRVRLREDAKSMLRYRGMDNAFLDFVSGPGIVLDVAISRIRDEKDVPMWTSIQVEFPSGKKITVSPDWVQHAEEEGSK